MSRCSGVRFGAKGPAATACAAAATAAALLLALPALAAGPFQGRFSSDEGTLQLTQQGARVTGFMEAEGVQMPVEGQVAGSTLQGQLQMFTGEAVPFTAQSTAQGLIVQLVGDPETSVFQRVGGAPVPPAAPAAPAPGVPAEADFAGVAPAAPTSVVPLSPKGPTAQGAAHRAEYEGWSLRVPRAWKHREQGGRLLLGGDTEAGLIVVLPTPAKDAAGLQQGLVSLLGDVGMFPPPPLPTAARLAGGAAFYTEVQGTANTGEAARVRAVAVVGPRTSIAVVGATTPDAARFGTLSRRVDSIARSVRFFEPKVSPGQRFVAGEWWSFTSGSTATSHGGTEGSLAFCPGGRYVTSSESSYQGTLDSTGTYTGTPGTLSGEGGWLASGRSGGAGRWRAVGNAQAGVVHVTYPNGTTGQIRYEVRAGDPEGGVRFDGRMYARTNEVKYCR